jgi:hypothetical protein
MIKKEGTVARVEEMKNTYTIFIGRKEETNLRKT